MKILIISPTQKGIGGIAQHVQGLSNFLKKNNHDVDIISSENTFTIPIKGLKNPSFMLSSLIKSKFKKQNDIIHAHNIPASLAMKNIAGKKILTLHGIYSQQISKLHGKVSTKIASAYERKALESADVITVVTKEAYDHYTNLGFKIHHIPNAIDIKSLPSGEDRRYKKQVIFAGRLSPEKGIDTLVEVAKNLPSDIHILILGIGPEENKIKNISKENVHFLGYQLKTKTIELIRGSDILIQPSKVEGLSSTILEAMACKTTVIATEVGGNKEIIENGRTGFLVKQNSSNEIIKQIKELVKNDQITDIITNKAFEKVKKYDWSFIGNMYLDIYKES